MSREPAARYPTVTVRGMLGDEVLAGATLIGGASGLDGRVLAVAEALSPRTLSSLAPSSLVVFARDSLAAETASMDLAIRLAHSAALAALVVDRPSFAIPVATTRLADKLSLPVISVAGLRPHLLVSRLDALVHAPRAALAKVITATVERLQYGPTEDARSLVARLRAVLAVPVALVDGDGRCLAGDEKLHVVLKQVRDGQALPSWRETLDTDGGSVVVQPVRLSSTAPLNFWLAAWVPGEHAAGNESVAMALSVAAWAFAAYLANRSLGSERESRQRSALLEELLRGADAPRRRTLERATTLGWGLSGWHTGIEIDLSRGSTAEERVDIRPVLADSFARQPAGFELVEWHTGWVCWSTSDAPPDLAEQSSLTEQVRDALLAAERDLGGVRLCAGIGNAHEGTNGLAMTLDEAHEASLLARGRETRAAVEHLDVLGLRRMLAEWFASESRQLAARQLLEPLLAAEPNGSLVRTLGCFLDCESSTTTTAKMLDIHRNTVVDRLERIRRLLPVDIDRPDDRLVVHLATRLVALEQPASGGEHHNGAGEPRSRVTRTKS